MTEPDGLLIVSDEQEFELIGGRAVALDAEERGLFGEGAAWQL